MAEIDRSLQIRAFLDTWFLVLVVALVLVSVVLGWWAYGINMEPDVREEQRLVEDWSESTSFTHGAEITNDSITDTFNEGEFVENRPIYYTNLAEELNGTYAYEYDADTGDVEITTDTYLLIRAGELDGLRMTETFWEISHPLEAETSDSVGPDGTHVVEFDVSIPFVLERIATAEQEMGATEGLIDVRVVSSSTIEGDIESETVEHTYDSEMIMVVQPATFRVIEMETVSEQHEDFETVEVLVEPSPIEAYGSIVLFVLALAALASLGTARYLGYTDLSEDEREILRIERAREQFSEWITTGTFPSEREYEQTVLVDDLEGLVDVAIDTNKRVIEDEQLGVSTVLDDNYIYIYVRPDSPARDWLVNYADTTLDEFDRQEF